jgi:hypothetical protein
MNKLVECKYIQEGQTVSFCNRINRISSRKYHYQAQGLTVPSYLVVAESIIRYTMRPLRMLDNDNRIHRFNNGQSR